MSKIGRIEAIWRYPVKGMKGEEINEVFVGFGGVMGDRVYGVINAEGEKGFPWFTARDDEPFMLYKPRFKHGDTLQPENLAEFENIAPGIHPLYPESDRFSVDVETPEGEVYDIESHQFVDHMNQHFEAKLSVHRSAQKSQVDCRPLSLFSQSTTAQLTDELGIDLDYRRFRPNFLVSWDNTEGFFENSLIGKRLTVGGRTEITPLERDPRCKMVSLDPDTAEGTPRILKHISTKHEGFAGVYGAVLKEGMIRVGDEICLA